MIHIAICEDNDADMTHLRALLHQTKILCDFTEYTSAEPMLLDMENGQKHFDLFLLDIFLPGRNGVETARRIRSLDEKAVLIFLTVSEDFYREAFDLYAFHYLIKPIRLSDLTEVLTKAANQISSPEETLPILSNRQKLILRQADIVYIESASHMLCFHMQDGQQYVSYGKLNEIQTQLASELFVRCHKSFIANLIYVSKLTREGFYVGDTLIPISRTYAADAKNIYYKRLFGVFQEH